VTPVGSARESAEFPTEVKKVVAMFAAPTIEMQSTRLNAASHEGDP
jgi:hypothetical protein